MSKIDLLIRELRMELPITVISELEPIFAKYATKQKPRIPGSRAFARTEPHLKRDRAPRPKPEALIIYPDGREVCNQKTFSGRMEYERRRDIMVDRQQRRCAMCAVSFDFKASTFDHQMGRNAKYKDERIWTPDGNPQNAALCWDCNDEKGSKRTPYKFQVTITQAEYEATKGNQ